MKVGDLVRYTPDGLVSERWESWYGIVIKEIPGTDERKVVMWCKDNSVQTNSRKKDLTLVVGK